MATRSSPTPGVPVTAVARQYAGSAAFWTGAAAISLAGAWAAAAIRLHPILEVLEPFGAKALVVRILVLILSAAAILRSLDERRHGSVVAADAAVFLSGCALWFLFSPVLFAD